MTTAPETKYLNIPTEETEQITLFNWARTQQHKYPELRLMYHIPNGGQRSKSEAARFKAAGVRAGVPDIFLPCPRSRYHGLYIELKRVKGGRVSGDQESFMRELAQMGYAVYVCFGWKQASETIIEYMEGQL